MGGAYALGVRIFRPTLRRRAADGSMGPKSKTRTWWADFTVHGRRHRVSTGTSNRTAAAHVAAKLAEQRRDHGPGGDPFDATRRTAPADLVSEYAKHLRALGRAPEHVDQTEKRAARLLDGIHRLDDVTPQRIGEALDLVAQTPMARPHQEPRLSSPQTVNAYRRALGSVFGWLVRSGRWPSNPVLAVPERKVTDATFERRALTAAEVERLVQTAATRHQEARGRGGLPALLSPAERAKRAALGAQRAALYALAASSGMRRGECAGLAWSALNLEGPSPSVRVRASTAKNAREATLPLHPLARATLLVHRQHAPTDKPLVFGRPVSMRTFRGDLAAAGIEHQTEAGVVDFHSLRVAFATMLARAGVPLAQAQRLLRHSTPVLTANVYTRLELSDATAAVARLPLSAQYVGRDVGRNPARGTVQDGHSPGSGALRATGTDGPLTAGNSRAKMAPRPGLEPGTYGLTVRRSTS